MFFGPRRDVSAATSLSPQRLTVDPGVAKATFGTGASHDVCGGRWAALSRKAPNGVSLPRMQTSDRTRGVALLVPRLLSIQTDPAEFETADAVAEAIERSAEALLRWHDEIAEIQLRQAPPAGQPDPVLVEPPADGPAHASKRLARQVRSGTIPADPASLEGAAAELHSIAHIVTRAADSCSVTSSAVQGREIAAALLDLSGALRTLAHALRIESRRLVDCPPEEADQVLGRVVRAEHAARLAAATTLRGTVAD